MFDQTVPTLVESRHRSRHRPRLILAASLSVMLAACGGGGTEHEDGQSSSQASDATGQSRAQAQALTQTQALMTPGSIESGAGWVALSTVPSGTMGHGPSTPPTGAKIYYVNAASTATTRLGTKLSPWKTLADVQSNAALFKGGDAILLKCGSIWRETLQLSSVSFNSNLLIGAYGSNCTDTVRPVVKGTALLSKAGWTRYGTNSNYTYVKSFTASNSAVQPRLFLDNKPLTQARFPNKEDTGSEFATLIGVPVTVDSKPSFSKMSFTIGDSELRQLGLRNNPAPILKGATVHIRTAPWMIETRKVDKFDAASGLVTLDAATKEPIMNGAGYILEGKPWMLTKAGQWAYDDSAKQLYWWAPLNKAPKDIKETLEVASLDKGFQFNKVEGISVERIQFEQQKIGMAIDASNRITVTDIVSKHAQINGLSASVSDAITVQDSKVIGAGEVGLNLLPATNLSVRRNLITDTGLLVRADGSSAAIVARSSTRDFPLKRASLSRIEENQIVRSANVGIFFSNDEGTTVHRNTVIQPCVRLTDCGGIYTFTDDQFKTLQYIDDQAQLPAGATVSSNVILGAQSNVDGSFIAPGQSVKAGTNQAVGIYLDELTARTKVIGNTVANSEVGIYLHLARFNTIADNTVVSVSHASFQVGQDKNDTRVPRQHVVRGNQVLNNRFFSQRPLDASKLQGSPVYAIYGKPVYAQLWENTQDGDQSFFTDANGPANVSNGNTVYTTSNVRAKTWRVDVNNRLAAQHGGVWGVRQKATVSGVEQFDLAAWKLKSATNTDTESSPLAFKPYLLAQPEATSLVKNGNFDVDLSQWQPNPYPTTNPAASLTWINTTPCSAMAPCGRWLAHKAEHYLASNKFPVTANELYLLRYTLTAGSEGAIHRANVRKTGPTDYSTLGFNFLNSLTVAPGQEIQVEQFFRATDSNADSVLSLTASDGSASKDIYVSKVSLIPISATPTFRSEANARVTVTNASDAPVSRDCAQWQLSTYNQCDLRDGETGQVVTWPLIVPARGAKVLYFNTPQWLDN